MILPDGSRVALEDCKVELIRLEESAHLVNLMAEGDHKLEIHQEYDRRRAVLHRLANPYFELRDFPRVCRHGPLKDATSLCPECEKDKLDALRRLGR